MPNRYRKLLKMMMMRMRKMKSVRKMKRRVRTVQSKSGTGSVTESGGFEPEANVQLLRVWFRRIGRMKMKIKMKVKVRRRSVQYSNVGLMWE